MCVITRVGQPPRLFFVADWPFAHGGAICSATEQVEERDTARSIRNLLNDMNLRDATKGKIRDDRSNDR